MIGIGLNIVFLLFELAIPSLDLPHPNSTSSVYLNNENLGIDANFQSDTLTTISVYLFNRYNLRLSSNINALVILSEMGCASCNKQFSQFMEDYVKRDDIIFLISASGGLFDVEKYYNLAGQKNILIDNCNSFNKLNILSGSGVIFFTHKNTIEIVKINNEELAIKLRIIEKELEVYAPGK